MELDREGEVTSPPITQSPPEPQEARPRSPAGSGPRELTREPGTPREAPFRAITASTTSPTTGACPKGRNQSFKATKLKIKEEPGDEIKDYAETTMNELLGWYGYEQSVHKEDTRDLDLKRFTPKGERLHKSTGGSTGKRDSLNDSCKMERKESDTKMTSKSQMIAAALNLIPKQRQSPEDESVASPGQSTRKAEVDDEHLEDQQESNSTDSQAPGDSPSEVDQKSSNSPEMTHQEPQAESAATCEQSPTTPCLWCQKPTGDKSFSLKMEDGTTKLFCTDLCFTMCRRASFKKNKVCDWCKNIKNTVTYVDFQDGEQQLQFCGEQCLNQYKMNIFCKETQEHLQTIKSAMANSTPPTSTSNKQIIITPELWNGSRGDTGSARDGDGSSKAKRATTPVSKQESEGSLVVKISGKDRDKRSELLTERKLRMRARAESSHSEGRSNESRMSSTMTSFLTNHMKHRPAGQVKADSRDQFSSPQSFGDESKESLHLKSPKKEPSLFSPMMPKSSSHSSDVPLLSGIGSKMFSSTAPKDCTKHGPSESSNFPSYALASSPSSDVCSTPRSSISSQLPGAALPSPGGLPASQLLSSLGPNLPPWMYNPLLNPSLAGMPGLELGLGAQSTLPHIRPPGPPRAFLSPTPAPTPSSSNSQAPPPSRDNRDTPQTATSSGPPPSQLQAPGTGGLPLRPPFSLGGVPGNLLSMMAPGMPPLLPMAPSVPNPMISGLAGGMLPPNTLMVPYPVVIPLPIPLPLTVPIPITCEKDGTPIIPDPATPVPKIPQISIKQEKNAEETADASHQHEARPSNSCSSQRSKGEKTGRCSAQIACACCQSESKDSRCRSGGSLKRRLSSSPPSVHERQHRLLMELPVSKLSSSHLGHQSSISSSSDVQSDAMDLSKDKSLRAKGAQSLASLDLNRNNTILRESPSSGSESSTPQFSLGGSIQNIDSAYSARRSLILDAPSLPDRQSHSPGVEKRLFIGGLSKEHAYGKRRCIRPRIRTK